MIKENGNRQLNSGEKSITGSPAKRERKPEDGST